MTKNLHVVLGASGGAGSALVTDLVARGHRVRAVSRRPISGLPSGVEHVAADVATRHGADAAVAGAVVVHHAAQPELSRWSAEFPALTRSIARATARADAKLVLADNLYAYGPVDGPLTERTPQRPDAPKAAMRAEMADALLAEHAAGRLRVAIGRSSDYFGPGGVGSALGEPVFTAALAGKTVRWPGPVDVLHTMSYLPDVARGLAVLGEADAADGQVWHLPAAEPLTGTAFAAHLEEALGQPVKLSATGAVGFWVASHFVPVLRELNETRHQWQAPFVSDASRFLDALGPFLATPHAEALRATVAWWRARLAVPVPADATAPVMAAA